MLLVACISASYGQEDFGWWNDLVNWNGSRPWRDYIQLSTSGLGPNALPVPTFFSAKRRKGFRFENQLRYHHNAQDPTFDHQVRVEYGFADRVTVAAWMVTVEHYNTSVELRNERRIREFEPKGFTSGDVYFATFIEVVEESQNWPAVVLSANIKTASGNHLKGGRHTDSPGYYFDLLAGKQFGNFRPYFSGGLYVYQTYSTRNHQNDAYLYGLGCHYSLKKHNFQLEWAGYNGYFNNGDKPSVLRANIDLNLSEGHHLLLQTQFGLKDMPYQTFALGYTFSLQTNKNHESY